MYNSFDFLPLLSGEVPWLGFCSPSPQRFFCEAFPWSVRADSSCCLWKQPAPCTSALPSWPKTSSERGAAYPHPAKRPNPSQEGHQQQRNYSNREKNPSISSCWWIRYWMIFTGVVGFFFSLTNKNNFKNTTESSKFPSVSMCNYKWYTTATDSYLDVHMKWSTHEKATAMVICVLIVSTVLLTSRSSRNTQKSVFDKWKKALTGQGGLYFGTSANCKQKN